MKFIFGNSIFETLFSKLFQIHFFEIHIIKLTLQISLYKFRFLKSNFLQNFAFLTANFDFYFPIFNNESDSIGAIWPQN